MNAVFRILRSPVRILAYGLVIGLLIWTAGAVYYLLPDILWLRGCGAMAFVFCAYGFSRRSRSRAHWIKGVLVVCVLVWAAHALKTPSNNRIWAPDHALLPHVEIQADAVTIRNYRRCRYRSETEYDVSFEDLQFSLSRVTKVWFVVQRFTALEGIAHNFLTFAIDDEAGVRYFTVSIEIRREAGELFSPVKGMYREFEIIYLFADELDQIGSRTVFRPDDRVYLFPVNATEAQVQQLFLDIAARANALGEQPEFYNSFTNNCTNNIVVHTYPLTDQPFNWLDPRIVAPGFADRFAWSYGLIGKPGQPFADVQQKCRIDPIARATGVTEELSNAIRQNQQSL